MMISQRNTRTLLAALLLLGVTGLSAASAQTREERTGTRNCEGLNPDSKARCEQLNADMAEKQRARKEAAQAAGHKEAASNNKKPTKKRAHKNASKG